MEAPPYFHLIVRNRPVWELKCLRVKRAAADHNFLTSTKNSEAISLRLSWKICVSDNVSPAQKAWAVRSVLQFWFFRKHSWMFRGNQFHSTWDQFWDFGMLIKILCHNTNNEADVHKSLFLLSMQAYCAPFRNMCTLLFKNTGFCWCGAVLSSSSPFLRITKLQGEQEAHQGLVGTHEDAMIIKTVSDFPVSLPSLPRQSRALPDAAAGLK